MIVLVQIECGIECRYRLAEAMISFRRTCFVLICAFVLIFTK